MDNTIDVLNFIIDAMVRAENIPDLDGESKQNAVITYLKKNLAPYNKHKDIIPIIIELVIIISKTKLLINVKKKICCVN